MGRRRIGKIPSRATEIYQIMPEMEGLFGISQI